VRLSTFTTADEFLRRAQAWLEEGQALNSLMLGIALRLEKFPDRIEKAPYLAVVEDELGIVAAALMTPPWNLGVASQRQDARGAFEMIAHDLANKRWNLPGTIGPARVSDEFASVWHQISGKNPALNRRERLFELHLVNPIPRSPGNMRVASELEAELVMRWATDFTSEALDGQNLDEIPEMTRRRLTDRDIYLWDDARPVAMAARTRPATTGISVSLVYTPPEFRRRGYATSLVAQLSQALLESGYKYCALFTDLANPTSNHIYQEIGYKPVCDINEYRFV
jgi:uncharacterized protein